ncbi:hypothetical protein GDO86_006384 [Hymenochirus boettgeri]|uniref:Uncharacterized protein n=1 Tax=Hymenochirus boettgeri TaxID=247094 RepID=A0A8T2JAV4_9PIPI|nr:hypothetical protein GDO86_006384 [Hymenochirus boettgeri]
MTQRETLKGQFDYSHNKHSSFISTRHFILTSDCPKAKGTVRGRLSHPVKSFWSGGIQVPELFVISWPRGSKTPHRSTNRLAQYQ